MKNLLDEKLIDKLKASLSKKRFEHSLGVSSEAKAMAKLFGADEDKAWIAGILHDCAKGLNFSEQIQKCKEYGLILDDITKSCKPVIHAPLGAAMAEREYGIKDDEILQAIRYHTVGGHNMTLLDKIIYMADMTEPHRDFEGVEELRNAVKKDIDEAFFICVKYSLKLNLNGNKIIHPSTLDCYNDILAKMTVKR